MVYDRCTDSFNELRGEGTALGIDETLSFKEYRHSPWSDGQIILIGTDGIWEAENLHGERYGKDRVKKILRRHRESSSQKIVQAIIEAVVDFRQTQKQNDDITLVVIKLTS
jgi:sigma-B regulation protein RsbU (phosphoserine phosphatase)